MQGVGFRAFVARQASQLGIKGWVKNHSDGTVVCLINSDLFDKLDEFEKMLRKGPRWSKVAHIDVKPSTQMITSQTFEIIF